MTTRPLAIAAAFVIALAALVPTAPNFEVSGSALGTIVWWALLVTVLVLIGVAVVRSGLYARLIRLLEPPVRALRGRSSATMRLLDEVEGLGLVLDRSDPTGSQWVVASQEWLVPALREIHESGASHAWVIGPAAVHSDPLSAGFLRFVVDEGQYEMAADLTGALTMRLDRDVDVMTVDDLWANPVLADLAEAHRALVGVSPGPLDLNAFGLPPAEDQRRRGDLGL